MGVAAGDPCARRMDGHPVSACPAQLARVLVLYPVCVALALSALGGAYETYHETTDSASTAMPGRLVDVGGHKLHIDCTGTGSPTVVLEPGMGEISTVMAWIALTSPPRPGSASTTAPDAAGASLPTDRRTAPKSQPTSTPSSSMPARPARTCSLGTLPVGSTP